MEYEHGLCIFVLLFYFIIISGCAFALISSFL